MMPVHEWHPDPRMKWLGQWQVKNLYDGARGLSWKMLETAGLSPAEIDETVDGFKKQIIDGSNHLYHKV